MNNKKNKYIIVGKSGSGKSYKALNMAIKNTGTTIICNGFCALSDYSNDFPALKKFIKKDGRYSYTIEENAKYFIESFSGPITIGQSAQFVLNLIRGCDYGCIGNDESSMAVFDDGSWNYITNRVSALWELSHMDCKIIITCQCIEDLLNMPLTEFMKNDISQYWNIIYL